MGPPRFSVEAGLSIRATGRPSSNSNSEGEIEPVDVSSAMSTSSGCRDRDGPGRGEPAPLRHPPRMSRRMASASPGLPSRRFRRWIAHSSSSSVRLTPSSPVATTAHLIRPHAADCITLRTQCVRCSWFPTAATRHSVNVAEPQPPAYMSDSGCPTAGGPRSSTRVRTSRLPFLGSDPTRDQRRDVGRAYRDQAVFRHRGLGIDSPGEPASQARS